MKNTLEKLPVIKYLQNPTLIFFISLFFFSVDNVANYFMDVPVFVVSSIVLLPLMWIALAGKGKPQVFLMLFTLIFVVVSMVNNLVYDFHKSSISDLVFILFFATSWFYYREFHTKLKAKTIHIFLAVTMLMFGFAFFGINSNSLHTNDRNLKNLELVGISFDSLISQGEPIREFEKKLPENIDADSLVREKLRTFFPGRPEVDTMKNIGIGLVPGIKVEKEELDKVEKNRTYNYGLFRVPHVPAYFFGFLLLFYLNLFKYRRKAWYLLIVALLTFLIFYNGVRTFVVAAALSAMLWFFIKRNIWFFVAFLAIIAGMIIFRNVIFDFTKETIFQPLSSLLITVIDNPDRLSRIALFRSWFSELQEFKWYDFIFGKNFYLSRMANLKNLFTPTWYHNDLLSVIFSYGVIAAGFYIALFINIFREHAGLIHKQPLLFVFYFSMILASVFNGFYYYFPLFLLYIYWMIVVITNKQTVE